MERSSTPSASAPESVPESGPPSSPAPIPDRTLEISMPWLGRTIRQTRAALAQLAPGQVLAVHADYQTIVAKVKEFTAAKPTAVISTINGDSNVPFYKELGNQGVKAEDFPVIAFSAGEEELRGIDTTPLAGHLAAWNYFMSMETPQQGLHRKMAGPVLGALIACPMIIPLSTSAAASELSGLLPGLGSSSRTQIAKTVSAIGDLGDPAALPALKALRDKRLRADEQGNLYLEDAEGGFLIDLFSGERTPEEGLQLNKPCINNRVRRELKQAIAKLQLFSPDPDSRLQAAQELAHRPSDEAAAQVRIALEKETVPEVRDAMAVVLAQLDFSASDPERRLAAIVTIGEGSGLAHKAALEKIPGAG